MRLTKILSRMNLLTNVLPYIFVGIHNYGTPPGTQSRCTSYTTPPDVSHNVLPRFTNLMGLQYWINQFYRPQPTIFSASTFISTPQISTLSTMQHNSVHLQHCSTMDYSHPVLLLVLVLMSVLCYYNRNNAKFMFTYNFSVFLKYLCHTNN